ncbi:MAG: hypothetical protein U1E04_17240 [Hylemonella sp.]|nr:hypothetical protein [Hylemonella sp.]
MASKTANADKPVSYQPLTSRKCNLKYISVATPIFVNVAKWPHWCMLPYASPSLASTMP